MGEVLANGHGMWDVCPRPKVSQQVVSHWELATYYEDPQSHIQLPWKRVLRCNLITLVQVS